MKGSKLYNTLKLNANMGRPFIYLALIITLLNIVIASTPYDDCTVYGNCQDVNPIQSFGNVTILGGGNISGSGITSQLAYFTSNNSIGNINNAVYNPSGGLGGTIDLLGYLIIGNAYDKVFMNDTSTSNNAWHLVSGNYESWLSYSDQPTALASNKGSAFFTDGDNYVEINALGSGTSIRTNGNISAPNVCYSNGSQCTSTGSGMNYTNVAMTNQSNNFTEPQVFNDGVNITGGTSYISGDLRVPTSSYPTLWLNYSGNRIGFGNYAPLGTKVYMTGTFDFTAPSTQYIINGVGSINTDTNNNTAVLRTLSFDGYKYGRGNVSGAFLYKGYYGVQSNSSVMNVYGMDIGIKAVEANSLISNYYGFSTSGRNPQLGSITTAYGFYFDDFSNVSTTSYGFYVKNQSQGTSGTHWGIYSLTDKNYINDLESNILNSNELNTSKITSSANNITLQQTGDTMGTTKLTLLNRVGANGAQFENLNVDVVDFLFKTPNVTNMIRMEGRTANLGDARNTGGEVQIIEGVSPYNILAYFGKNASGTKAKSFKIGTGNTPLWSQPLMVTGTSGSPASTFTGIGVYSNNSIAADIGAEIGMGGYYTGTTATQWAAITGWRNDSVSGNYNGEVCFWTRETGGSLTKRLCVKPSGEVQYQNIVLSTCSVYNKNSIGANATGTYGCNSTDWVRLF